LLNNNQYIHISFLLTIILLTLAAKAQYKVQGNVYDSSRTIPLQAVSVLSSSGKGTTTDANGHYSIDVGEKDSIWFSYLNKPTVKYPVLKIADVTQFDIALHVNVETLKEVKVIPRNYRQDSIQNRMDYAKAFNFRRPNLESMTTIGAAFDLDELIRVFQFRKNRSMERFRERLLQEERDKFVDHRFNKQLVRRLTNLSDEALNQFIILYRPSYEFSLYANDYDFQAYIKSASAQYRKGKGF